jgi:arsenate reductase
MSAVTIYHNPRCTKSRQTLELLRERGVEPTIIEYLKEPPDEATLERLLSMLGLEPLDLIRKGEPLFKELGLAEVAKKPDSRRTLIRAMAEHPVLIERPIVVRGGQARLGRPPERVAEIL